MQDKQAKKEWLSPKEIEEEFGISKNTLSNWRAQKKYLPFVRVGKLIKYKRSDVEAFLAKSIVEVTGASDANRGNQTED